MKNYKRTPLILATPLSISYLATLLFIKEIFDQKNHWGQHGEARYIFGLELPPGGCFCYLFFKCFILEILNQKQCSVKQVSEQLNMTKYQI